MAATVAAYAGASVIVLEKEPMTGGSTRIATGAISCTGTILHEKKGVTLSTNDHYKIVRENAAYTNDPEIVRVIVETIPHATNLLIKEGLNCQLIFDLMLFALPNGSEIINTLGRTLKKLDVPILLNTTVTKLMMNDAGRVTGVRANSKNGQQEIKAKKAVIIATGGFAANPDMVKKNDPRYAGMRFSSAPSSTGDGIKMAEAIGAGLADMDQVMPTPTTEVKSGFMITTMMREMGSILVNHKAERFVDESLDYLPLSAVMLKLFTETPEKSVFLIFDERIAQSVPRVKDYIKWGYTQQAGTIEELAAKIGLDPGKLKGTLEQYNGYVKAGKDPQTGKKVGEKSYMSPVVKPDFYAIEVNMSLLLTRGGIRVNPEFQVLNQKGVVIPGLYAVGETIGGFFGHGYVNAHGTTQALASGYIAGKNAVREATSPAK